MADFCTCGAELPPDALFCHKCGKPQREIVEPEPWRIQRAYVEGAFLRRLFRLLVDGEGGELDAQVRAVMARHYSFHLAAVEAVEADRT